MSFDWREYAEITLSISVGIAIGTLLVLAGLHTLSMFVGSAIGIVLSMIIIKSTKKASLSRDSDKQ